MPDKTVTLSFVKIMDVEVKVPELPFMKGN
jgi:hypothetical protein